MENQAIINGLPENWISKIYHIQEWILIEKYGVQIASEIRAVINRGDVYILDQREKAIYVSFHLENSIKKTWIPRQFVNIYSENENKQIDFSQTNLSNYTKLITWCKENGVKGVRDRLKKDTVLKKLNAEQYEIVKNLGLA